MECTWYWAQQIQALMAEDRSGSVVLQEAMRRRGRAMQWSNVGMSKIILTRCWYIWWQQRQVVHGEEIQPPPRSQRSRQTITWRPNKVL